MKNDWQQMVRDLLTIYRTADELTIAVNLEIGDGSVVAPSTISRIKNSSDYRVYHDLGQALLVLHVRYVRKDK